MINPCFTKAIAVASVLSLCAAGLSAQEARLGKSTVIDYSGYTGLPNFIRLNGTEVRQDKFVDWALYSLNLPAGVTFKAYDTFSDELGFTHTRYHQYVNNYPVEGSMVITHTRNGLLETVNGDYYRQFSSSYSPSLTEAQALQKALDKVNATLYAWDDAAHEASLKEAFHDPSFTFKPKGELVIVHKKGTDYAGTNMRLAWKFNIYAEEPLYRANLCIDAATGEVIAEENLIKTADVPVTAATKFSGSQTITMDNFGTNQYRLRETGRGNGITTQNMKNGTSYTSVTDFTTAVNTWTVTGTDQAAADAHNGAEKTYDYYKQVHNRNSIDGNGFALHSYMHYSTNYVNAFWNGTEMTYGDGQVSQGFLIMTALDVCGHEITHGLTSKTSNLNGGGSGEPDALNEGNSDIFGTTIEWFARPNQCDWIMGADITCNSSGVQNHLGIRDMTNPNAFQQPDTYNGTYWDASGEPHTNNGPFIFWYYLLCQGGSGTNDIGNAYNVAGITMNKAKFIAFRQNTVYFTPSTTYANARNYSIQAATDLYGACSPELASTTNAWYAVGVGAKATNGVPDAAFSADKNSACSAPLAVQFSNGSTGATTYAWDFGDGSTSTIATPAHTYSTPGLYAVTLIATGTCSSTSKDTLKKTSYITVNGPPTANGSTICGPASANLSASGIGSVIWKDGGGNTVATGSGFSTPSLSATTTYYASSNIVAPGTATAAGGPAINTTLGAGSSLNYSHYLIFNATTGFTLKTVDVYANTASSSQPTIQLADSSGTVIASQSFTLTAAGKNTVTLNFRVNKGNNYHLIASGTNINLYRNSAGATYPMMIGSFASVTGTDASATAPAYYYYFYNWNAVPDVPCSSAATAVTVTVNPKPSVTFNYTGSALCNNGTPVSLTASPAGGIFSGTNVSSGQFNPNGLSAGTYILTYTYTNAGNCSNSDTAHVLVTVCTTGIAPLAVINTLQVYPNPAQGVIFIRGELLAFYSVTDVIGQVVVPQKKAEGTLQSLDISTMADGVYLIKAITNDNRQNIIRFIKN